MRHETEGPKSQVPGKSGMNLVNIEMVIFDARGFAFGTEVSRIISVLRPCEGKREEGGGEGEKGRGKREEGASLLPRPSSLLGSPSMRKDLESVPLVDLSTQLRARERGAPAYAGYRAEISSVESQESSLKSIPGVGSDMGRSQESPLQRSTDGDGTAILLVNTTAGAKGVHVESVRGIVRMPLEHIEPLPEFLKSRIQTDCIWGIGKLEEELIILLDLDRYVLDLRF